MQSDHPHPESIPFFAYSSTPGLITGIDSNALKPHLFGDGSVNIDSAMLDPNLSWALVENFATVIPENALIKKQKEAYIKNHKRINQTSHLEPLKATLKLISLNRYNVSYTSSAALDFYAKRLDIRDKIKFYPINKYVDRMNKKPRLDTIHCNNTKLSKQFIHRLNQLLYQARGTQQFASYIYDFNESPKDFIHGLLKQNSRLKKGEFDNSIMPHSGPFISSRKVQLIFPDIQQYIDNSFN